MTGTSERSLITCHLNMKFSVFSITLHDGYTRC